jgi:hypothetical protein
METDTRYNLTGQVALFFEKVIWTFAQAFVSYLVTMSALGADAAQAATLAGIAAAGTAGLAALPLVPNGLPFATDLFFRVVRTFVVSAGTLFFAGNNGHFELSVGALEAAAVSALPVALVVAKGLLASKTGESTSAATLPSSLDPNRFAVAA